MALRRQKTKNEALWIPVFMLPVIIIIGRDNESMVTNLTIGLLAGAYAIGVFVLVKGRIWPAKAVSLLITIGLMLVINHVYITISDQWLNNGIKYEYYQDGGVKSRRQLVNGLRHGQWVKWHRNSKVNELGYYRNDTASGNWKYFNEFGKKESEGVYVNNLRCGVWRTWYNNGQLQMKGVYYNDRWNGWWKCWHQNGGFAAYGYFIDGEEEYTWYMKDEKGELYVISKYKKGVAKEQREYQKLPTKASQPQ